MIQADQLTFGVEIETIAPASAVAVGGLRIGSYRHGIQVPYLPPGWTAERDGSIIGLEGGHACEIVSPVLGGADGLAQVADVLQTLQAKGHRVNASCAVHVHVGWKRDWPSESLARLVTIVAYVEKGLYAITGTKQRERGAYCGGVRRYGNKDHAKDRLECGRYHALNLTNLAHGTKDTVEFRVFSGSLQVVKVLGWIQVCLGLVERALAAKRLPSFSPRPPQGGWKKAGEGQSEVERLFGFLAWEPGYARIHGGRCFGWLGAGGLDQVTVIARHAARRDTVHDKQLVIVSNVPAVLLRCLFCGLSQGSQEIGVAAAECLAHGGIRREEASVLKVVAGGVHVRLRPDIRLRKLHDLVFEQQVEHRRTDVVTSRTEMVRCRHRLHREHPLTFLLGCLVEGTVRSRRWLEPQLDVLVKR